MSEEQTILVIEDNDFVRMQIVSYLQSSGYDTVEARDGKSGMDVMLSEKNVDLAVVDVNMEPVGGFDFILDLRGRDIGVPVVLVTGDDTTDLLERAGKHSVNAVLMKPVEKSRLVKTVERTIEMAKRKR